MLKSGKTESLNFSVNIHPCLVIKNVKDQECQSTRIFLSDIYSEVQESSSLF